MVHGARRATVERESGQKSVEAPSGPTFGSVPALRAASDGRQAPLAQNTHRLLIRLAQVMPRAGGEQAFSSRALHSLAVVRDARGVG